MRGIWIYLKEVIHSPARDFLFSSPFILSLSLNEEVNLDLSPRLKERRSLLDFLASESIS